MKTSGEKTLKRNWTPEQEAIAFLRSMLKLVERSGVRHVDEGFGFSMAAMATGILDLQPEGKKKHHACALSIAASLFEEASGGGKAGPSVSLLRAAVMIIEDAVREKATEADPESTNAPQEARQ